MSYAQVIVRFTDMPNLDMFTTVNTSIKVGLSRYAVLTGKASWNWAAQGESAFPVYTSALATAKAYRDKFLALYGPNGSITQNDLTVGPVMPTTHLDWPFYIVIDFNYYVGDEITVTYDSPPIHMEVTQELVPGIAVINAAVSAGASCDLANFSLTLFGGTAPFAITRSGQLIANSLSFDFSRSDAARDIVITDANEDTAAYTLPFVREYFFGQITQVPKIAGTDITIGTTNSGLGSPLTLEYSVDGVNWQSSNFFPLVEPGPRTIYFRDDLGCEKQLDIVVEAFQVIDVRAVHNPVNFEITKPSAGAPAWVDIAIEMDGRLVGTYKAHPWRIDNGNTIYLFSADEPIRQYMPAIDDYPSQINSATLVQNMQARVAIKERTPGTAVYNEVATFIAVNASRQIGLSGESLLDLLQNNEPPYVFVQGQPGYLYWYDNGFYREKMLITQNATITRGGKTKAVEILPYCDGDVILKYLDRNGMYRFYKFSRFYRREIEPELIGSIENVFGSLSTAQGYKKNIGYRSQDELTVKAVAVPARHMESLKDIYTSPRVYMHIGALGDDNASDWVLVDVEGDGMIKHNRRQFNDIELTILPPANNEITML